jgi:hypothetical protein
MALLQTLCKAARDDVENVSMVGEAKKKQVTRHKGPILSIWKSHSGAFVHALEDECMEVRSVALGIGFILYFASYYHFTGETI